MSVGDQTSGTAVPLEHPRGIYPARVDSKGRLKIPAAFVKYLDSHGEKHFYVTTLNVRSFYIFTLGQWKVRENILENPSDSDEYRIFRAMKHASGKYGADATIDGEGRMLIPQLLREQLALTDRPVWLEYTRNGIEVYGEDVFNERDREADAATLAKGEEIMALRMRKPPVAAD